MVVLFPVFDETFDRERAFLLMSHLNAELINRTIDHMVALCLHIFTWVPYCFKEALLMVLLQVVLEVFPLDIFHVRVVLLLLVHVELLYLGCHQL